MSEMLPTRVQSMIRGETPIRRGWKRTVKIKHLLNQEGKSDAECARAVLTELEKDTWAANARHGEILDEMRCAVEEIEDSGDLDGFNDALDALYDEADEARVWIG